MKCKKLEEVAWDASALQIVLKAGRPNATKANERPVYFDGEFVRVGAGGVGLFLDGFVAAIKDREIRHKFLWAVMTAGFTEQVLALCADRHVERPTLRQSSDVNRLWLNIQHQYKPAEFVEFVGRVNAMLRAGLLRLNNTGALVIATKPGE